MLAITAHERAILRDELDWYGSALDDLKNCMDGGRSNMRLRWRVHIALALLDDLGWQHEDPRDEFFLTLDRRELAHWLRWTLAENDGYIEDERHGLEHSRENAIDDARLMAEWGEPPVAVADLERTNRGELLRSVDRALELRLDVTAVLERIESEGP